MAPMMLDAPAPSRRDAWKSLPEPTIYPVKEYKFEKPIETRSDGYEKAKSLPEGEAAIVIDNGTSPASKFRIL